MLEIPSIPETITYRLKPENSMIRIYASFSKNPVGTYDDTILLLYIQPIVAFPLPIQYFHLYFSDDSLNKVFRRFKGL